MMRLQLIEQFLPCRVQRPIGTGQFFQEVAFRSRGKSRPRFAFVEAAFGAYLAPQSPLLLLLLIAGYSSLLRGEP